MEKKKIILIDGYHKVWSPMLKRVIEHIYGEWAEFEVLEDISDNNIDECYQNNPAALFIQGDQLSTESRVLVTKGLFWVLKYGKTHSIILFSGDDSHELGFRSAQYLAKCYIEKENPVYPMTHEQRSKQVIGFHKTIISHLELSPGMIWQIYSQLGYTPENA